MMLSAYGRQEPDCISRASHTFPQRTTGALPNTQLRDGSGFSICSKKSRNGIDRFRLKLLYLGRLPELD